MKICIFMKIRAKHLEKIFQNLHFFWNSWVGGGGLRGGNVRPRGSPLSPNLKNWKINFGTIKSRFFGIFDRNARNFGQKSSKNRDFWPFSSEPRITPGGRHGSYGHVSGCFDIPEHSLIARAAICSVVDLKQKTKKVAKYGSKMTIFHPFLTRF